MSSAGEASLWTVRLAGVDGERTIEVRAASAAEAARIAGRDGATPLSVQPTRTTRALFSRSGKGQSVRLASELALLLRSGMQLEQALASLSRLSKNRAHNALAEGLLRDVRGGKAFHEAVAAREDALPPPFAAICEAGEASGSLDRALSDLAEFLESRQRFDEQMRGALIYPAALCVGALIALIVILTVVTPRFEALFDQGALTPPAFTQAVFAAANFIAAALPFLISGSVLGAILFTLAMRDLGFRKRWRGWMLTLPVIGGFNRDALAARFTRLLALMLRNGLSAAPALRLAAAATGDDYARERLDAAVDRVRTGRGFAEEIAAAGVLPDMAPELLRVGEDSGDLAGAAERLAEVYAIRVERAAQVTLRLLEPAIIVGVGVVLGGMIISILLALVSANEAAF